MQTALTKVWLADDDRQVLLCAARHAEPGRRLGRFAFDELKLDGGLPGRVYQQGRPQWIPVFTTDTASLRSRAAARIGSHVAVGVPISSAHILGAQCVYGDHIEVPEDSLTSLLTGVAAQVGQYPETAPRRRNRRRPGPHQRRVPRPGH